MKPFSCSCTAGRFACGACSGAWVCAFALVLVSAMALSLLLLGGGRCPLGILGDQHVDAFLHEHGHGGVERQPLAQPAERADAALFQLEAHRDPFGGLRSHSLISWHSLRILSDSAFSP